jgi:HemY protein
MSDDVTADLDDERRALPVAADEAADEPGEGTAEPEDRETVRENGPVADAPKPKPEPVVFPAGPPDDPGLGTEPTARRSFFG